MIGIIIDVFDAITALGKTSPIVAGAISLWGLTVITFILKVVPIKIVTFLKTQLTSKLEIDNAQGYEHKELYYACMEWFSSKKGHLHFSRSLAVYSRTKWHPDVEKEITEVTLGPGYGTHFFFFNRQLLWVSLHRLESAGSEIEKRALVINCLGRSKAIFNDIIFEFAPKQSIDGIFIYTPSTKGWEKVAEVKKRPLQSIALDESIKTKIIPKIEHFNTKEDWFIARGLPYKLTFILHGVPGTGKTSLIKALASYYGRNICILNLNSSSDTGFQKLLMTAPKNSIIVIEDFDATEVTQERGKKKKEGGFFDSLSLSLSGILNGLDGIQSLHDNIIFLTTNHLEAIDPAIYRKGRVDAVIEMKETSAEAIKEYSTNIFPDYNFKDTPFVATLGCNLNHALLESQGDPEKYIKILNTYSKEGSIAK